MTRLASRLALAGILLISHLAPQAVSAAEKPNIIILFADDISARELPIYGSSVWGEAR